MYNDHDTYRDTYHDAYHPIIAAAKAGQLDYIKSSKWIVDTNILKEAFSAACKNGHVGVAKLIYKDRCSNIDFSRQTYILDAYKNGHHVIVRWLAYQSIYEAQQMMTMLKQILLYNNIWLIMLMGDTIPETYDKRCDTRLMMDTIMDAPFSMVLPLYKLFQPAIKLHDDYHPSVIEHYNDNKQKFITYICRRRYRTSFAFRKWKKYIVKKYALGIRLIG